MKILLTTIAALLLVGCGESQQSTALTESKSAEPVAEASDISIHEAAALGNIEAVKQFLDSGTDVNAKDKTGGTPLDEAAGWGRKDIVELLIAKGADVNAKFEDDGSTPLHLAAWKGHFETAELLIAKGADVNAKIEDGRTSLDRAEETNNKEIADLLRKHGGKTGAELKAEGK